MGFALPAIGGEEATLGDAVVEAGDVGSERLGAIAGEPVVSDEDGFVGRWVGDGGGDDVGFQGEVAT